MQDLVRRTSCWTGGTDRAAKMDTGKAYVSCSRRNKYHRLGGIKQHNPIPPQFWSQTSETEVL